MAVNNSLRPQNNAPAKPSFSAFMTSKAIQKRIGDMLGGNDSNRFVTSIISAVTVNPALAECDHFTILSAAMLGESLKLSPSPQLGHYYMVPFKQKAKYDRNNNLISPEKIVAQFQLGYKGFVQLAQRSGYYKKLNVMAIKEGELIGYNPLEEEISVKLVEDDTEREALPTIGYYAFFEYHNGFRKTMYWSKEKMVAHADKFSQAFSREATTGKVAKVSFADYEAGKYPEKDAWKYSSFWYKDFDGMAYKTMLRQLISKWGIMSIDLQTAYEKDMATIREDGSVDYVDNSADYVEAQAAPVIDVEPSTGEVVGDAADPTAAFFGEQ